MSSKSFSENKSSMKSSMKSENTNIYSVLGGMIKAKFKFPLTKPIDILREDLTWNMMKDYAVSPKLNGIRKHLLIDNSGKSILISKFCKDLEDFQQITNVLLDCEEMQNGELWIFDVIYSEIHGGYVADLSLRDRVEILEDLIIHIKLENFELRIKYQRFYTKSSYSEMLNLAFDENVSQDGLIFTHRKDYFQTPLRWKSPEFLTIDFLVDEGGFLNVAIPGKLTRFRNFVISDVHNFEVRKVYEFQRLEGSWIPVHERSDKSSPNFITVADHIMSLINDPILRNEILILDA